MDGWMDWLITWLIDWLKALRHISAINIVKQDILLMFVMNANIISNSFNNKRTLFVTDR